MNENLVTISRSRYEELIVAEQDANRLKDIISSKVDHFAVLDLTELRILRDLLIPKTKEEEEC